MASRRGSNDCSQGLKPATVLASICLPLPTRENRIACTVPVVVFLCHTTKLDPVLRTPDGNIGSRLDGNRAS